MFYYYKCTIIWKGLVCAWNICNEEALANLENISHMQIKVGLKYYPTCVLYLHLRQVDENWKQNALDRKIISQQINKNLTTYYPCSFHFSFLDSSTKKYIQMCKKEIEKQDIKLQATYKAMFGGSSKSKSDNVNNVSVNSNHLSSGDAPSNGISDINETSWSIVYIRDYYKKNTWYSAICNTCIWDHSTFYQGDDWTLYKYMLFKPKMFLLKLFIQSCNLQKNCLMLLSSLKKKKDQSKLEFLCHFIHK